MADPFIGQVTLMGFNFNPRGWFKCNGALLSISQHSTLFSLLGTNYGGDGRVTFALPDLRGRVPMSYGRHPGSLYDWRIGQVAGAERHTMTVLEMATHSHDATFSGVSTGVSFAMTATTDDGDNASPSDGAYLATTLPPAGGPDKPEQIYNSNPSSGSLVQLGGVSVSGKPSGSVTINANGAGQPFSLMQPTLALNHCIANVGVYPPRS
ncbi:phage tail protein [Saccharobesus litoralis]|uniref:Phage tail protein n=1 Tax=Saccharobesus litoralis TaxID=2172099 RepID=A0A2S0VSU2_9ALTE|nr:tail fiber protein [Saccharobesus litoralis]AWB67170.1 phage tail protein [Saccharobesus litoralis]